MTHNYLNSKDLFISLENPEVKSEPTGVSTFAIRTSQCTDQKLQKNFHLTDPKKNFKIFFQCFKKNKIPDTQARYKSPRQMTQTDNIKMVVTNDRQERQPYAPTRNWRFSLRINICGENRQLLVATKR